MSRVDWGWVLSVAIICWPFAFCALLAIRQGGRRLAQSIRTHRKAN